MKTNAQSPLKTLYMYSFPNRVKTESPQVVLNPGSLNCLVILFQKKNDEKSWNQIVGTRNHLHHFRSEPRSRS